MFTKINGVKYIKSVPYHLSTNGVVERLVQTFKKAMKASEHDGRTHSQQLSSFLTEVLHTQLYIKHPANCFQRGT